MKALVAVDGSDTAEKAFHWYLENMHRPHYEIIMVHSGQQPHIPTLNLKEGASFPSDEIKNIMVDNHKKITALQDKFETKCEETKSKHKFFFHASDGTPGEQIVHVAESENCDVIIIGSRGQSALRRTILGSVSDYVIHHTHVPVVVCPKQH